MCYTNKVQLEGYVGQIQTVDVDGRKESKISLAIDETIAGESGAVLCDRMWIMVSATESADISADLLTKIGEGYWIKVDGKLKYTRYVSNDGSERVVFSVVATRLEITEYPF